VRATQRLISRGFEAYLVGGCVRDLLLGRPAKDYDIATGARPQQVKRVFPRNCRIIGRRFKLAHLHFPAGRERRRRRSADHARQRVRHRRGGRAAP
jgi:poly(A) polymerase